jgi:hypothetical protein
MSHRNLSRRLRRANKRAKNVKSENAKSSKPVRFSNETRRIQGFQAREEKESGPGEIALIVRTPRGNFSRTT